jgi:predicted MFS family arabinose efflux permease
MTALTPSLDNPPAQRPTPGSIPTSMTLLLAIACGLVVANVYYAQPLVGPIGTALGLSPQTAGLLVTATQIGYGAGLLFIVPLADLIENRLLVVVVIAMSAVALLGASFSATPVPFLIASLFIGLTSVTVQILIPYSAHLAPEAVRGRVVGNVTTGLMLGVMLARPVASFLTAISSWHLVFLVSAVTMLALVLALARALPPRIPTARIAYGKLLASMGRLVVTTPVLRRRALYQAGLFAAFSLFWTAAPLLLADREFQLSQRGIALFALAGVAGAIAAPIAGRVADRGWSRPATGLAMTAVAAAFLLTHIVALGSTVSLVVLTAAAILLDFGVQANVVLGYRALFMLGAEYRSRLNGVYMATFYTAGAIGSGLGAWCYAHGGWALTSWVGFALPVAALLYFATERRGA